MVKVYYLDENGYITGSADYPDYTAGTFDNENSTDIKLPEDITTPRFDKDRKVWIEADPGKTNAYQIIEDTYIRILKQIGQHGGNFKIKVNGEEKIIKVNNNIHKFISYASVMIIRGKLLHPVKYIDRTDSFIEIDNLEDLKNITLYFSELFHKFNELKILLNNKYKNEEGLRLLETHGAKGFSTMVEDFITSEFASLPSFEELTF